MMSYIFTALKIICVLPIHCSLPVQPLATSDLFAVSVVLPFPEWHILEIIQYATFTGYLLSLSN